MSEPAETTPAGNSSDQKQKHYINGRPDFARVELGGWLCSYDLSNLCQNWILVIFGTASLVLWIVCVVATFSMKSAIHVYKFNHDNVTIFASGKEGDNCWDKDAFLHLGPIEYLNGRLSILALGVLPAAAWSAMQILKWCAGNVEVEGGQVLKKDDYLQKMEQSNETGEDVLGLGKCLNCCPQTFNFSNVSFQTTIGVSLFNLLGVFALIMDSFAVKQWNMSSCSDDIKKLIDKDGKEMYDPTMPGFDFKNLPWLLMCTNLLAFAMGIVTLTIACVHLSRHIDRHYDRNGEKYYERLKDHLGKNEHTKGILHHLHTAHEQIRHHKPAAGASQFLPEVRHMGGYRPVYAAWPV